MILDVHLAYNRYAGSPPIARSAVGSFARAEISFSIRYCDRQRYPNVRHKQAPSFLCQRLRRWRERNGDDGGNVESVQFQQQDPAGRTKLNHSACRVLRSFGPRLAQFYKQIVVNYRTKFVLLVVVYYFDTRNHGRNVTVRKSAQVKTSRDK